MNCDLQQREDSKWWCPVCDPGQQRLLPVAALRNCKQYPTSVPDPKARVGTTLHDILYDRFGVDITKSCACKEWIAKMNQGGPEWCREKLDGIVSKMLSEAKSRDWVLEGRPLLSKLARLGTILPWGMAFAREWARKLVLEAIELSERKDEKAD